MARDVDVGQLMIQDLGAQPEEVVQGAVDQLLVARDRRGGDHHRVAGHQAHVAVLAVCHPHQSRGRFSLAAGTDDHRPVGGEVVQLSYRHQPVLWDLEIAQLSGHSHVLYHAAAHHRDLPTAGGGGGDHLLYPRDVGGEGSDDNPASGVCEDLVKGCRDLLLRGGVPLLFGVGAVGEQDQYALSPQPGELGEVGGATVHRGVIELEISRVDRRSHRGVDCQPHPVGDAVADGEEFHVERSEFQRILGGDGTEVGSFQPLVLLQLNLDEATGEGGSVDRRLHVRQEIGKGPDMVLVAVGDHDPPHPVAALADIAHVGDHDVHPRHLCGGEHETSIDDEEVLPVLHHHHVLADLPHAAQGEDPQLVLGHLEGLRF